MSGICQLSSIALRSEPSHRAEMVNQLIYGEKYEVLETVNNDWLKVKCSFDNYEGFMPNAQFSEFTFENEALIFTGGLGNDEVNNIIPKGAEIYNTEALVEVDEDDLLDLRQIHFTADQIKENIFTPQISSLLNISGGDKGAGIGLLLVKGFVEKNGGEIWVESIEGEGSSFYFTLPTGRA